MIVAPRGPALRIRSMNSRPGPARKPGLVKCSSRVIVLKFVPFLRYVAQMSRLSGAIAGSGIVAKTAPTDAAYMKSRRFKTVLQRETAERLIQPVADLGDAGVGTGFVLVAPRRTTDANGADRLVAGLDW